MSQKYTVMIKDSQEGASRQLVLEGPDPMYAHKRAYMKTNRYEEVTQILDETGDTVFDGRSGFKGCY